MIGIGKGQKLPQVCLHGTRVLHTANASVQSCELHAIPQPVCRGEAVPDRVASPARDPRARSVVGRRSSSSPTARTTEARASEIAIYSIVEGSDASTTVTTFLDRITQQTGGRSWFIGHIEKLPEAIAGIVRELRSSYFITYTPKPAGKPGSWHQIEVRVSRSDAVVRAKKEYLVE